MNNKERESEVLARLVAQALDTKKGEDIRVLDLRKVHGARDCLLMKHEPQICSFSFS